MLNPKIIYNKAISLLDSNSKENSNLDYYEIVHSSKESIQLKFDNKKDISVYKQVIELLNEFNTISPNCKYSYVNLGIVYHHINDFENSILNYNKAIAIDKNYYKAHYNLGILNLVLKNNDVANGNFTNAIISNPNYINSYYNRGCSYINLNNYIEAIQDLSEFISREPNFYKAYQHRALCYMMMKNYNDAINDYSKAISLNPNYAYSYKNRGICYLECDNYENAISDFEKTIELGLSNDNILKLLYDAKIKLEDSFKPDKKAQIIQAICNMNILALEELLDDYRTYQDATKEVFLSKIKEAFEIFKEEKDTHLIPYPGVCDSQSCGSNINCRGIDCKNSSGLKGQSFIGNISNYNLNLIFVETDNSFKNMFNCSSFKVENENINSCLNYRIDVKLDEKARFYGTPENLELIEKCKLAYNEIDSSNNIILSIDEITNWLNIYADLFSTLGYNAALFNAVFNFYNLYRLLKTIEKYVSFKIKTLNALIEFEKIEKAIDYEVLNWLLKFENLNKEISKLDISFKSDGTIKYRGLQKRFNVKIDFNEIKYGISFDETYNDYYLKIAKKYKIFINEELELIDKNSKNYSNSFNVENQFKKDGLEFISNKVSRNREY